MKLALAGSYREFILLVGDKRLDYHYLSLIPQDIRGLHNVTLVTMGSWRDRKDVFRNWEEVFEYCISSNIMIEHLRDKDTSDFHEN